jgi:hypothetical protein
MNHIYIWFGGRSTFFALGFFTVGSVLAFHDKLSVTYVSLAGAIQALIAVKSVAQDYHDRSLVPPVGGDN